MSEYTFDHLNADSICAQLTPEHRQRLDAPEIFESISSTNEWGLQQCRAGRTAPFVCYAEQQSRGRGRRGKIWVSPERSNIYMSLAWTFALPVNALGTLPMVMGVAVIKTLEQLGVVGALLKWPNDVFVQGQKISGVLIETCKLEAESTTVVIGVGLNYAMPDLPIEDSLGLDQLWTDICRQLDKNSLPDRNQVAGSLLQQCIMMCERYQAEGELLFGEYTEKYDACRQQAVRLGFESGESVLGLALGITERGMLRVLVDGEEREYNSAEVSLRNILQGPS